MKLLRNILIGLLIGAALVFAFYRFTEVNNKEEEPPEKEQARTVELLSPSELEDNVNTLLTYGEIAATSDLDLTFEMSGVVDEIYISPGSYVEENQILAKLESETMDSSIAQAKAAYDAVYWSYQSLADSVSYYDFASAEAQLKSAEIQLEAMLDAKEEAEEESENIDGLDDLKNTDSFEDVGDIVNGTFTSYAAPSDAEIEIQELIVDQYGYAIKMLEQQPSEESLASQMAYVEQAQASLDSAYAAYDAIYLRAPFEGEVTTFDVEENQMVSAGMSVGKIINRDNIETVVYLSSDDASSISVGNYVLINDSYEGSVVGISSRVDDQTGKLKTRICVDDLYEMTSGETVKAEINQDKASSVTLVPLSSILFDDEKSYIFFYYDGAVYKRLVNTGAFLGDFVEIIDMPFTSIVKDVSGLRNGQEVSLTL